MDNFPGAPPAGDEPASSTFDLVRANIARKWQHYLDKTTTYQKTRWISLAVMMILYYVRVHILAGWYIVTYGLAIYLLNLFIGFLSPPVDSETDSPVLPLSSADQEEYRPFTRRVGEFKFWYKASVATVVCFFMTFFNLFNIPVFWPILLVYFVTLFGMTMKRQIKHMRQYGYVPWSYGKKTYAAGDVGKNNK